MTLGDTIASFLNLLDVTIEGNCILGDSRFNDSRPWGLLLSRWTPKRLRWLLAQEDGSFVNFRKCQQELFLDLNFVSLYESS